MDVQNRRILRLDIGGEQWRRWWFGPYGKSKNWRLHAPDGQHFQASELREIGPRALDLDYLETEVKRLRALVHKSAYHFDEEQIAALQIASRVLAETFNTLARRRA